MPRRSRPYYLVPESVLIEALFDQPRFETAEDAALEGANATEPMVVVKTFDTVGLATQTVQVPFRREFVAQLSSTTPVAED
jgi:hypothetical protein